MTPTKHIVHDKANPNSQTISPAVQNLRKFGMNLTQLSSKCDPKVSYEGVNMVENRNIT